MNAQLVNSIRMAVRLASLAAILIPLQRLLPSPLASHARFAAHLLRQDVPSARPNFRNALPAKAPLWVLRADRLSIA